MPHAANSFFLLAKELSAVGHQIACLNGLQRDFGAFIFLLSKHRFAAQQQLKTLVRQRFSRTASIRKSLETHGFRRILTKANFLPGAEKNPGGGRIG
jgi:hypothetical protein